MSGKRGKMKPAQAIVDAIQTPSQAKARIKKASKAIGTHKYIITQEEIKILTYRKQIALLKKKFPNL
jgi:hypothetical protein